MISRPPIVAILGHVDHGKTTLLDYIRKSHITEKEHGGITQRIGAYEISTGIKGYATDKITFIDTPGHEAFSQLRARGARVADIALLVVDAKDSLMPQTIESIYHIKTANIPFIVVINKMDLPDANPEKVKNELLKHEVATEDKGGKTIAMPISAKTGKGISELLESILLVSSDLNLQYDPQTAPKAYIIETKKDRRGVIASVIIKDGTLKTGDTIYIEDKKTSVKAMIDDRGNTLKQVVPSTPFELLGFEQMPEVGSFVSTQPQPQKEIERTSISQQPLTLDSLLAEKKEEKKLYLVLKTDSQGSLEAITHGMAKKDNVEIVLQAVGDVYKSDIFLAKTTKAIIVGFNIHIAPEARDLAKQEKVIIKTYSVIYDLLDELGEVSELLKEKEEKEKSVKGEAKVLATFIIEGEKVTGVSVTKGKINLGDQIEVYRGNNLADKTKLVSLKVRAKVVQEVKKGMESGMVFSPQLDMRVGDVIKSIL